MSKSIVRVAVIGCGRIAGHHCRSVQAIDGVELISVCDLEEEKCGNYGEEFSVPAFTNYHEMFEAHPEINTVAICTPSGMHFEHGLEILQEYKKNLIVEKPTFMRPSHVKRIYDTAESLSLKVFPVFQNRYNKAVQRVKAALDSGQLGDVRLVNVRVRWCRPQRYYDLAPWRGTYAMDGGALSNQGIHHIDLLRYLGGEVSSVNATMRTVGAQVEVEDSVVATLRYANDVVGSLEVTTAARPDDFEASLSLVCEKGLAQLGGIAVNELQIFTLAPEECDSHSEDFSGCVYGLGHEKLYQDMHDDLSGKQAYPITRADCLKTIELWHAFYVSSEENEWVSVSEGRESSVLGMPDDNLANLYRTVKTS